MFCVPITLFCWFTIDVLQNEILKKYSENGKSNPSVQMLGYICEELGVSMSEFYDEGNQHPELIKSIIKEAKRLDKKSLESVLSVMKSMGK